MLINSARQPVVAGALQIPSWLRAPLSLNNGSPCWGVLHRDHAEHALELILTTIPPVHWADLWRIEVEFLDRPGILFRFLDFLAARGILVQSCEGCLSSSSTGSEVSQGSHEMSFVVSCRHYDKSLMDGKSPERTIDNRAMLRELFYRIVLHFSDDIAFSGNGRPRLRVRRFDFHRRLAREYLGEHRKPNSFVISNPLTLKDDKIELPRKAMKLAESVLGKKQLCTFTAGTKRRIVKGYLYPDDELQPLRIQILIEDTDFQTPREVARVLSDRGINIIKSSIRRGRNLRALDGKRPRISSLGFRLDLTCELPPRLRNRSDIVVSLRSEIGKIEEMRRGGLLTILE